MNEATIIARVDDELKERVRERCQREGIDQSALLRNSVRRYLESPMLEPAPRTPENRS
jgi:hypothetical protein